MPEPKKKRPPAREEWDFNPSEGYEGCPETELPFCFVYEYARESAEKCALVAKFRQEGFPLGPLRFENIWRMKGLPHLNFLRFFPEFPKKPWLKIPAKTRERRIKALPAYDPPITAIARESLSSPDIELEGWTPRERFTVESIKVNWSYTDAELGDALRTWVEATRPATYLPDQIHGTTNPRDWLKKLGAKRLLARLPWDVAAKHTEEVTGERLYTAKNTWLRPAAEATDYVNGNYPDSHAIRLIAKIGLETFSVDEVNAFFPWLARATPGQLKQLEALSTDEARAKIRDYLNI